MRVLVVNPVGHSKWDEVNRRMYKSFASESTDVEVMSLPKGPTSVETAKDYAEVKPLVVRLVEEKHGEFNAVIVNCFLDPGVARLRRALRKVVVGPGEASLSLARNLSSRLAVITVGGSEETLSLIWERVKSLGFEKLVFSVRGIQLGVVDLDKSREETIRHVVKEAEVTASEGLKSLYWDVLGQPVWLEK